MYRNMLLWTLALALTLPASKASADEFREGQLTIDGARRSYFVHGAIGPTPKPLLLVLHGGGGNGRSLRDSYGFKPVIERGEAIALYPNAGAGGWVPDDVAFLDALVDRYIDRGAVDPSAMFVTGASRGGLLTFVMAAESRHRFTAAATVITTQLAGLAQAHPIERPIDFLMIAGTDDPLMPYDGGWGKIGGAQASGPVDARLLSVADTLALLHRANGISGQPRRSTLGDANPNDGCSNQVERWARGSHRVELITVIGGGHVVPGGRQYLPVDAIGRACTDFHHADVTWQFFQSATAAGVGAVDGAGAVLPPATAAVLDAADEQALRDQVAALYESLRRGDIAACLALSDPDAIAAQGRHRAERFFRQVSNLTRASGVQADDRRIEAIELMDGEHAEVSVAVRLTGAWQPPAREIWRRSAGTWLYVKTR